MEKNLNIDLRFIRLISLYHFGLSSEFGNLHIKLSTGGEIRSDQQSAKYEKRPFDTTVMRTNLNLSWRMETH